jgi:hypothetical protein
MKKIVIFTIVVCFFSFNKATYATQSPNDVSEKNLIQELSDSDEQREKEIIETDLENEIVKIDEIEIGVESCQIRTIQKNGDGETVKAYSAATASPKNSNGLPYGEKGRVYKITFNPSWSPTENIQKENIKKFGKRLPKEVPPGKNNPLGTLKLYIAFPSDYTLGIHGTNEPKSIGKRVSHGCNRLKKEDIEEVVRTILEQNGYDADELFERAAKNPKVAIAINLKIKPAVTYFKE